MLLLYLLLEHPYSKFDKVGLHFVHTLVKYNWGNNSELKI